MFRHIFAIIFMIYNCSVYPQSLKKIKKRNQAKIDEKIQLGKTATARNPSTLGYLAAGSVQFLPVRTKNEYNTITDGLIAEYIKDYNKKYPDFPLFFDQVKSDLQKIVDLSVKEAGENQVTKFPESLKKVVGQKNWKHPEHPDLDYSVLKYNKAYTNPLEPIYRFRGQCDSLTKLQILAERVKNQNNNSPNAATLFNEREFKFQKYSPKTKKNEEQKIEQSHRSVAIYVPGHVLFGQIRKKVDGEYELIGYESTVMGAGEINFGPVSELHKLKTTILPVPVEYLSESKLRPQKSFALEQASYLDLEKNYGININEIRKKIEKEKKISIGTTTDDASDSAWSFGEVDVPDGDMAMSSSAQLSMNSLVGQVISGSYHSSDGNSEPFHQQSAELLGPSYEREIPESIIDYHQANGRPARSYRSYFQKIPIDSEGNNAYHYTFAELYPQAPYLLQSKLSAVHHASDSQLAPQFLTKNNQNESPISTLLNFCSRTGSYAETIKPEEVVLKILNNITAADASYLEEAKKQHYQDGMPLSQLLAKQYFCSLNEEPYLDKPCEQGIKIATYQELFDILLAQGPAQIFALNRHNETIFDQLAKSFDKKCDAKQKYYLSEIFEMVTKNDQFNPCVELDYGAEFNNDANKNYQNSLKKIQSCLQDRFPVNKFKCNEKAKLKLPAPNLKDMYPRLYDSDDPYIVLETATPEKISLEYIDDNFKTMDPHLRGALQLLIDNPHFHDKENLLVNYFDKSKLLRTTIYTKAGTSPLSRACASGFYQLAEKIVDTLSVEQKFVKGINNYTMTYYPLLSEIKTCISYAQQNNKSELTSKIKQWISTFPDDLPVQETEWVYRTDSNYKEALNMFMQDDEINNGDIATISKFDEMPESIRWNYELPNRAKITELHYNDPKWFSSPEDRKEFLLSNFFTFLMEDPSASSSFLKTIIKDYLDSDELKAGVKIFSNDWSLEEQTAVYERLAKLDYQFPPEFSPYTAQNTIDKFILNQPSNSECINFTLKLDDLLKTGSTNITVQHFYSILRTCPELASQDKIRIELLAEKFLKNQYNPLLQDCIKQLTMPDTEPMYTQHYGHILYDTKYDDPLEIELGKTGEKLQNTAANDETVGTPVAQQRRPSLSDITKRCQRFATEETNLSKALPTSYCPTSLDDVLFQKWLSQTAESPQKCQSFNDGFIHSLRNCPSESSELWSNLIVKHKNICKKDLALAQIQLEQMCLTDYEESLVNRILPKNKVKPSVDVNGPQTNAN